MNVLFLSQETTSDNKRDSVTYNFIVKEMVSLQGNGVQTYFLAFTGNSGEVHGIPVISAESFFTRNTFVRNIRKVLFVARNIKLYGTLLSFLDLRRALWRAYCELAVIECVRKYKIDIVHTHFFVPNGGSAITVKKYCHVPVVATCRGAEICNMPQFNYGAMRCRYFRAAVAGAIPLLDAVTVPNKFYKKTLLKLFPAVEHEKVAILYNGVERISVIREWKSMSDITTFIAIGKLIPLKNYELILQAVELLRDDFQFKVVLVGDGILRQKFESIISEQYKENIVLHHEVPKSELCKMIAAADCLVHPSFSEGGANVILEALAIGVPCLVSDISSMQKEVVIENVNGFLFDPHSPEELAVKMAYAIQNREKLWEMQASCKKSVKPYSLENKIHGYLKLYQQLADTRKN